MQDLDRALDSLLDDNYVGFWRRTAAALIDSILMLIVILPISLMIYGPTYFNADYQASIAYDFWNIFLNNILPIAAVLICWHFLQATPGKILLGMKIVDADTGDAPSTKQYLIRYVSYILAAMPLLLGIIWVGIDKKKQGWHDKLANTYVVRQ